MKITKKFLIILIIFIIVIACYFAYQNIYVPLSSFFSYYDPLALEIQKSFGNIRAISLTKANVSYPNNSPSDNSFPVLNRFPKDISKITGIDNFESSDMTYFYADNILYAYGTKPNPKRFCGDSACYAQWLYKIDSNNVAHLLAGGVSMGGLAYYYGSDPEYTKGGVKRSSFYFKDDRGNIFINIGGFIYVLKDGNIIAKIDFGNVKFYSKAIFSKSNRTYLGDVIYKNNGERLSPGETRIYEVEI
jgi:hypothetical protein